MMQENSADTRYWNDPSGNIRRMEGEQDVIATVTDDCTNEELQAMVDGLECHADKDSLHRELEEVRTAGKAYWLELGKTQTERDQLTADNDRLRRELEETREELRVQKLEYQQKEATLCAALGMLNRQKAELARMRPVVEAVTKWRLHMSSETIGHLIETHAIYLHGYSAGKGGE